MAKKSMEMNMCPTASCGPKCIVSGILSAVAAAAGLWVIVSGVMMQTQMMPWMNTLLWYAGGFLLMGVAKCIKMKACGMCRQ